MDMNDIGEVVLQQLRTVSGCKELYHVTTLKGQRLDKQGGRVEVVIEIEDWGPSLPGGLHRFQVSAHDNYGRTAVGNGGADLATAIALVHWTDLDKEI